MTTTDQSTRDTGSPSGFATSGSADISATPAPGKSRRFLVDVAILLICALVGAFGTKAFVAQIFSIPSGSMQTTVSPGERVIAEKLSYRFGSIEHGDVIVFDGNGLFREPIPGATMFVKRVIGKGGDHVVCCDTRGSLTVNGAALNEGEYLYPGDVPSKMKFDVVVPEGKLWVMGDHRSDSADSRAYLGTPGGGFIPEDRVVGRAMAVIWPLSSARSIDSPTYRS